MYPGETFSRPRASAGGGYSTAHDLLRLLNALRDGKIHNAPGLGFAIAGVPLVSMRS